MRVNRIDIEHFLGFRSLRLDVDPNLQLVAGPNNAGKSSLVRLVEAFFSDPSGPDLMKLLPLNKYYRSSGPRTLSAIQVWFSELSTQEEEVFQAALLRDGRIWVKLRCSRRGGVSFQVSRGRPAEESRKLYTELMQRFHFVKVPSVRVGQAPDTNEPESLERLLDTLEAILVRTGSARSTALQREFKSKMDPVEDIVRDVLNESAASIMADLPFQEQIVRFRLPGSRHALRAMLESAVIQSEGDATVPIAARGTGFQSALVLGILRYVAQKESQAGSNLLFAIEEPEAFLHPQTQRAMAKVISDISADAQVLVTTHSPVLVDSHAISRIARLPLQVSGTEYEWTIPKLEAVDEGRLSRYCSAANSELVFASVVLFVEGEGDKAVLDKLLSRICKAPGGHYALGVTVIEAAGLSKIRYLVQLAEHFGVRSYVLADRDSIHTSGGKRELFDILNERHIGPELDQQQALRFTADQHVSTLRGALRNQAALNRQLRAFDVFVLSSDLEGLFLDSFGVPGIVDVLGPTGEGSIDKEFAKKLLASDSALEELGSWMGSKGWNSDRKKSGKRQPHLAPYLLDAWFQRQVDPSDAMKPLMRWLESIVKQAALTPV